MSHLFWLHEAHSERIQHLFPKPRGVPRVDDRRVLIGKFLRASARGLNGGVPRQPELMSKGRPKAVYVNLRAVEAARIARMIRCIG